MGLAFFSRKFAMAGNNVPTGPMKKTAIIKIKQPVGNDNYFVVCQFLSFLLETAGPSCASGYFPCDGSICTALAHRCDGELDCYDGTDEAFCSNGDRVFQVLDIGTDPRGLSKSTLLVFWNLAHKADGTAFEFLPSYAKVNSFLFFRIILLSS